MRLVIMAIVTSIGTLAWTSVATGTKSAKTYRPVVAAAGPVASSRTNGVAEPPGLEEASGANNYTAEAVGDELGEEGPCGIPEEGQTSIAKPGSLLRPPSISWFPWEPYDGIEENRSKTTVSKKTAVCRAWEATKTSTPSGKAVGSKPRSTITATSSAGSESAAWVNPAEAVAGAGPVAVAWGNNYPAGQLGAGYKDYYETAPVLVRGLSEIRSMVPAGETSYALLDSGVVRAWGSAGQGDLGNDERARKAPGSPVAVVEETNGGEIREMTDVTAIAAAVGAYQACYGARK